MVKATIRDALFSQAPSVEYVNVTKVFSSKIKALDTISFSVEPRQVVALLGTSGCGKTTALRLLNRLEEPTSGTILVGGTPVSEYEPIALRRSIGYVIQEGGLFPHWTNAENVALVPRLLGWPEREIEQSVRRCMDLARIPHEDFAARYPASLSGGQRQRVAVARALAARPSLVLFDEAFGALDPITRDELHTEFSALIRRLEMTAIVVTHDVVEAFRIADRIVLIDKGKLVQSGSPAQLVLSPSDEFVKDFFRQHGLDLRMSYVALDEVAALLPEEDGGAGNAVEIAGAEKLADALDRMASRGCDRFVVHCSDGSRRGPFGRSAVWRLLHRSDR